MTKKKIPSLVIEKASDRGTHFYLSVIEYRKENYLVVIDNINDTEINAYVLDLAEQEGIDPKQLLSVITRWFYSASEKYPVSFEFSKLGITEATKRIYRTFEVAHVTRLIGNDFSYDIFDAPKIKRRRVSIIPTGVEIKLKDKNIAAY